MKKFNNVNVSGHESENETDESEKSTSSNLSSSESEEETPKEKRLRESVSCIISFFKKIFKILKKYFLGELLQIV